MYLLIFYLNITTCSDLTYSSEKEVYLVSKQSKLFTSSVHSLCYLCSVNSIWNTELLLFTKSPLTPQIEFISVHCTTGITTFLSFKICSQLIFIPSFLGKLIPWNEEIAFFFCHCCSIGIWLVPKCWSLSEYLTESRKILIIIRYGQ